MMRAGEKSTTFEPLLNFKAKRIERLVHLPWRTYRGRYYKIHSSQLAACVHGIYLVEAQYAPVTHPAVEVKGRRSVKLKVKVSEYESRMSVKLN